MANAENRSGLVTSTGGMGYERRSHRRGVETHIGDEPLPNVFARTLRARGAEVGPHGRVMVRTVLGSDALSDTLARTQDPFSPFSIHDVEVVAPFLGGDRHLVIAARNMGARQSPQESHVIATEVAEYQAKPQSPAEHMDRLHQLGYQFTSQVPEAMTGQLYDLWHDTFGWDKDQIGNFSQILEIQNRLPAADKDFWFSGVVKDGKLVAATMAQRLNLPDGSILMESTEWASSLDHKGKGLVPAAAAVLNAQILHDLGEENREKVLIYAECNTTSGAYKTALKAGMEPPSGRHLVQDTEVVIQNVLVQNVAVGDGISGQGHTIDGEELRNFAFTSLPDTARRQLYPDNMLQLVMEQLGRDDAIVGNVFSRKEETDENLVFTAS